MENTCREFILIDNPLDDWFQLLERAQRDLNLPSKPEFRSPCNHCGMCCLAQLCPPAQMIYKRKAGPCPLLQFHPPEPGSSKKRALCGLVLAEQKMGRTMLRECLGVGTGCSMGDRNTTIEELEAFDAEIMAEQRSRGIEVIEGSRIL